MFIGAIVILLIDLDIGRESLRAATLTGIYIAAMLPILIYAIECGSHSKLTYHLALIKRATSPRVKLERQAHLDRTMRDYRRSETRTVIGWF